MRVTFMFQDGSLKLLDIDENMPVADVRGILQAESGIPASRQVLMFRNQPIQSPTLGAAGVQADDIVTVFAAPQQQQQQQRPAAPQAQQARPPWAQPPQSGGGGGGGSIGDLVQRILGGAPPARAPAQPAAQPVDWFDPDVQRRLEQEIHHQNVQENLANAMEFSPESFARVYMLYIDCKVNNYPLKAFVDSGAQVTIMSSKTAEQCGVLRLLDRRFAGEARGVGTGRILGRVHLAPIEIGGEIFNCTFSIMEDASMDLLFGLDMLKRHQCIIDLMDNCLRVGTAAITVPFLAEKDLPPNARLNYESPAQQPAATPSAGAAGAQPLRLETPQPASRPAPSPTPPSPQPAPVVQSAPSPSRPPQPASSSAPAAGGGGGGGGGGGVNEQAVAQLTALGFTRQEAVMALQQAQGNVDLAASLLFGQ